MSSNTEHEIVEVDAAEYQKLVAGYEISERVRKKSADAAKIRAKYDKARDTSLKLKKELDEALRELEEIGQEAEDPQQRLPLEVDGKKDPKKRKPEKPRPEDHPEEAKPAAEQQTENEASPPEEEYEDVEDDEVAGGEQSGKVDVMECAIDARDSSGELYVDIPGGMSKSLINHGIKTIDDAVALLRGGNPAYPEGAGQLPHWGPGKTKKFNDAIEATIERYSLGVSADAPEPGPEAEAETPHEPAEEAEPVKAVEDDDVHLVKVRIKSPSKSLVEQGLTEGKVVQGKQQGKTVVVMADEDTPVTLIPKHFDLVA